MHSKFGPIILIMDMIQTRRRLPQGLWPWLIVFAVFVGLTKGGYSADPPPIKIKTEIKVGLLAEDFFKLLEVHELLFDHAVEGFNFFYDTPELQLYSSGLIARGRVRYGGKDSFTIKIRPIDFLTVHRDWFKIEGFDCEFDMGSTLAVPGCAINESRSDEQILNVARGRLPLVSLVSNTQNQFIEHFLRAVPDWDLLAILGPIRTFVWEIRFKTIVESESPKATLEFWMLPDGRGAGEISMRVPTDQALAERERLVEYLRNLGITKIALDESKTAWAMRYFASKLKPAE